jgi:ketosteroid isomerase-like protein
MTIQAVGTSIASQVLNDNFSYLETERIALQADVVQRGINVKSYGVIGDGSDETTKIQNTINAVIAGDSKLVFFPQGIYSATALTGLDQVSLVGNNATLDVGGDQVYVEQLSGVSAKLAKTAAMYSEAINEINIVPYNSLLQARRAVALRGEVRVLFLGDSITEGSDIVNDEEKYASRVEQAIRNVMPGKTVTVANYSLGGRNLYLATSPTFLGMASEPVDTNTGFYRSWSIIGESWIDAVKRFRPDVIVLAFGMNDASGVGSDYTFSFYADFFKSTIATWLTIPSVVVVPTFIQSASHGGSVLNQRITQSLARATRNWGVDNGYYVADANRLYNILINGVEDVARVGRRELDFINYPSLWTGDISSFVLASGVLTPNAVTNKFVSRAFNMYNGTIDMTFKQSAIGASGNLVFKYRDDPTFGNLILKIQGGSTGTASLYYNTTLISTSGLINIPISTNHTLKIIVKGSNHIVYVNNVLVLTVTSYRMNQDGGISIGGDGTPPIISNLSLSAMDKIVSTPLYTELDLLGKYNSAESGSATVHPSGLGHDMMYTPAFNGLVKELADVRSDALTMTNEILTYYVDPLSGSDTLNDGLDSLTPLQTIESALLRLPMFKNHEIVINCVAGTYPDIVLDSAYGRASVTINGGANLAAAANFLTPNIIVSNCYIPVIIKGFRATNAAQNAFLALYSTSVDFKFCDTVVSATGKYGFLFNHASGTVDTCNVSNRFVGIEVESQSLVTSLTNTGTGNTVGLNAVNSAKIGKSSTQPSGTTAEATSGGGTIS